MASNCVEHAFINALLQSGCIRGSKDDSAQNSPYTSSKDGGTQNCKTPIMDSSGRIRKKIWRQAVRLSASRT